MSLRIAVVGACPYPVPQGSQVFLRDNALALQGRGHHVALVTYGYGLGEDHSGLPLYRCANVPGARRTTAGPSWAKPVLDLALLATLRRVVRKEQIDSVIAHNYEALAVALMVGHRPVVYHAHNALADELPYYLAGQSWARRFGAWLDRTLPRLADAVVVPHERLRDYLVSCGCDANRVHVVPPPIDAAAFCVNGVSKEAPVILYTGNLDAYQNLGLLLEAVSLVRQRRPDTRLVIATHTPCEVPGAEVVLLRGRDDLAKVLAQDAVVALPRVSWSGYPIKLLNAMAAGKAVVACKSAAPALHHERNGIVVSDDDVNAFADAIGRLLDDAAQRNSLGHAARETVIEGHAPAVVGEQLERVIQDAITNR